jgi:hypothetical protein
MPKKMKSLLLLALVPVIAVTVFTGAGHAIQAKCVDCATTGKCEWLEGRDGDAECIEIVGGCVSSGTCTISLRFSP